jgi:hypothetical protein
VCKVATTVEAKIDNGLLARVTALAATFTPVMEIANPNRKFTPTDATRHFRIFLLRVPTAATALRTRLIRGILQVSVYSPENEGPIKADEIAGAVITFFDPQLPWLTSEGVTVRIDPGRPPYASSPLQDGVWWHVPVTINWFSQLNT